MSCSFSIPTRYVLLTALAAVMAVPSAQLFAQSFPTTGLKDFTDSMIETPDTSMFVAPDDPIFSTQEPDTDEHVPADPSYTPPPTPDSPDTPETAGTYEGPVGVTGIFNGNVTTGCSYDPLSHSAHRVIDDIVVPGSIGKYPLKMTRYYNSRQQYYATPGAIGLSPGWSYEYAWLLWGAGTKVVSPHGSVCDFFCPGALVGVSDGWDQGGQVRHPSGGTWRLSDGGKVVLSAGRATDIYDPYGLRTRIAYNTSGSQIGQRVKVTEPGGRCLWFIYGTQNQGNGWGDGTWLLTRVEAYDSDGYPGSPTHPNGNLIDWVNYAYQAYDPVDPNNHDPNNPGPRGQKMLVRVDYQNSNPNNLNDNTHAHYDYRIDNVHEGGATHKLYPVLKRADDVRYNGPMRSIVYEYQNSGPHGAIINEKCPGIGPVSAPSPGAPVAGYTDTFTETRGDGPTRTFTYTHIHRCTVECGPCSDEGTNGPNQQMLTDYTDFQGNTMHIGYDQTSWYITSVKDANNHTTYYERNAGLGAITKITHPGDGSYIQYGYQPETGALGGHYITSITDENTKMTTITRDSTRHWITRIDYPTDAYTPLSHETFAYDPFGYGLVWTHGLRNGAYVHYQYDGRGLLLARTNPTSNSNHDNSLATDPKTTYTYYTVADGKPGWIDRIKKMTGPAPNWSLSEQASETYEYDVNASLQPCAGRGLVTKITHADNRYQSFRYDQWGNKWREWNELGERTDYVFDSYNRIKSVTRANETTTYTYKPTNGNGTSPYLHTTNNPDTITAPTGILTSNVYDQNFRKTSTSVAGRTTWFHYDPVGNQDCVTDPRGTGPCSSGYTTTTQYDARDRKSKVWDAQGHLTSFTYDNASNLTYITRPDGYFEQKGYDALNRVIWDIMPYWLTNPLTNRVTSFQYNPSGTIYKVTLGSSPNDPNLPDHWTTFGYDASDRRTSMTYQNNQTRSWAYDDAGNMESRTTVNGETLLFGYDNRNRKYGESWWDVNAEWRYFGLDAASRLRRATNGIGQWWVNLISDVHRDYSPAGRLTIDRQDLDGPNQGLAIKDVKYEYDVTLLGGDGKPTRMYVPGVTGAGYDYSFRYDDMGRFEKILRNGNTLNFQYYYDNASNETKRHNQLNGVDQFYNPDSLNRIGKIELKKNGSLFNPQEYEAYEYDPMSRLSTVTRADNLQDQFGYYLDNELCWVMYGVSGATGPDTGATPPADDPTKEKTPEDFLSAGMEPDYTQTYQRAVTYGYDKAGNRVATNDNGVVIISYTPNDINQYQSISINNVADPITNGPEHEVNFYKNVNYTYMRDEHLVKATSGTHTYDLAYDALGRCVRRIVDGVKKYYIYDGERPILEYNASGSLVGFNLYGKGIDEILMRYDPTITNPSLRTFYYQQDHEGSVMRLTDGSGSIIEKYRYDVFGNPLILAPNNTQRTASIVSNRFMFTGREFSNLFGFYEYRARAYNPLLGRFMSEDPKLFDAGDYNLFRYVHNDPIDMTDPMGLASEQTGVLSSGTHDRVWDMDREYNKAMADAQWAGSDLLHGVSGATGIGTAGDQAFRTMGGPSVNWHDTGNNNIRQRYVLADNGERLGARTYPSIKATGSEDEFGALKSLDVDYRVDVKYATTAGPNTQKYARLHEPDHEWELRGAKPQLQKTAQDVANRYRAVAPQAVFEANRALQAELSKISKESGARHDRRNYRGYDDHITYRPYDW